MKRILALLLALLLIGSTAEAVFYFPSPVNGKVSGANVQNLPLQLTNLRSGNTLETSTSVAGEYIFDLANLEDNGGTIARYQYGDKLKIDVVSCSDTYPACTKYITYQGESILRVDFDLSSLIIVPSECPADTTPYDAESCKNVVTCPTPETITKYVCSDGTILDTLEDTACPAPKTPTDWKDIGLGALFTLIIGAVVYMGGGLKIYKGTTGKVNLLHKHRGIAEYHDVNVRHTNPKYSHRLFKDNPAGFAADVAKIEKDGGLI